MRRKISKVLRFIPIYGFSRTLIKVAGRTRCKLLRIFYRKPQLKRKRNVSLVGCGQYGFSTISYFLFKNQGNIFLDCFDINKKNAKSNAEFWNYKRVDTAKELIENKKCDIVYIASDHYSHTDYAIEAMKQGKVVYVEKPISVTQEQLNRLEEARVLYKGEIYTGYCRPFSKAILDLNQYLKNMKKPLTLSCFISGHKLSEDHWYNIPKEGTRVCGNLGHWIDLSMNLFHTRGYVPQTYDISIIHANPQVIDDDITVSYSTEYGDLVTLTLTSRADPFEGINETIDLQCGDLISKIDDFRHQTIWMNEKKRTYHYWPKDVGHQRTINQPFNDKKRNWNEVVGSTGLMLKIAEMVVRHEDEAHYILKYVKNGESA